ncbi:MAG: hypothetical protein ACQEP8_04150 [Chlamydiota bacterium]
MSNDIIATSERLFLMNGIRACLDYIRGNLPAININVYIEIASLKVAEKLGMVFVEDIFYHGIPVCWYKFEV